MSADDMRLSTCCDAMERAQHYAFVLRDLQCDHFALHDDAVLNRMLIERLRERRDALMSQAIRGLLAMGHPAHEADFIAAIKHTLLRDKK